LPPGGHQLPPLPYPYNALEPVISATALRFHHDQHHQSYVEGLNKAELKLVAARQKRDFSLIKHWERELAFHGSGHILHSIYWTGMAPPDSCGQPGTFTQKLIRATLAVFPISRTVYRSRNQCGGFGMGYFSLATRLEPSGNLNRPKTPKLDPMG
jgi:superoxide dismutase